MPGLEPALCSQRAAGKIQGHRDKRTPLCLISPCLPIAILCPCCISLRQHLWYCPRGKKRGLCITGLCSMALATWPTAGGLWMLALFRPATAVAQCHSCSLPSEYQAGASSVRGQGNICQASWLSQKVTFHLFPSWVTARPASGSLSPQPTPTSSVCLACSESAFVTPWMLLAGLLPQHLVMFRTRLTPIANGTSVPVVVQAALPLSPCRLGQING